MHYSIYFLLGYAKTLESKDIKKSCYWISGIVLKPYQDILSIIQMDSTAMATLCLLRALSGPRVAIAKLYYPFTE